MTRTTAVLFLSAVLTLVTCTAARIQAAPVAQAKSTPPAGQPPSRTAVPPTAGAVTLPPDYVIGPEDVLAISYWREKDLDAEVVVRPDGKISLPLLNEIYAAGLTPDQLREKIIEAAARFVEDPAASVVVTEIHSRKVFIIGQVNSAGEYPLTAPTTIMQLISIAGGLREFVGGENILIMRTEGGRTQRLRFNYKLYLKGKNLRQNIELRPGDMIIVP